MGWVVLFCSTKITAYDYDYDSHDGNENFDEKGEEGVGYNT